MINFSAEQQEWALSYQGAVIRNIRHSAPKCNPTRKFFYAEIVSKEGDLLMSATLDTCVERMQLAAEILGTMNLSTLTIKNTEVDA